LLPFVLRLSKDDCSALLAESLRTAISSQPSEPVGIATASFGVASFPPSDSLESWLERSDRALYAAEAGGRNRMVRGWC